MTWYCIRCLNMLYPTLHHHEKKYVINIKFHSKDPTYFDQWREEANCIMHDLVACPYTRSFTSSTSLSFLLWWIEEQENESTRVKYEIIEENESHKLQRKKTKPFLNGGHANSLKTGCQVRPTSCCPQTFQNIRLFYFISFSTLRIFSVVCHTLQE